MWMVLCGESGISTRSTVLMWMDGQYDEVEVEIRMWFISKFESGSFVDPKFFWMKNRTRGLDLWLLDPSSFNFLFAPCS
jgi:hypothetical protein